MIKYFHRYLKAIVITMVFLCTLQGCAHQNDEGSPPKPPRGYPGNFWIMVALKLKLLKIVDLKPAVPMELNEFKGIEYKRVGDQSLKLDIYQPQNLNRPTPVLIFIHGGAWKGGKRSDYLRYLIDFALRGYVTATVSYRFSQQAKFPAAVQDVKCAVKWIRAHAHEYNIDPAKIAVIGGSAGGHLAMMIGYSSDMPEFDGECEDDSVSSRVQAVVNIYGPANLTTDFAIGKRTVINFVGQTYSQAAELYQKASPITYITADDPPTLIFHGTIDSTVPIEQSDLLKSKLDEIGVPNEYHRLKGWPHIMDAAVSVNKYCQYYMNAFFEKYIPIEGGLE